MLVDPNEVSSTIYINFSSLSMLAMMPWFTFQVKSRMMGDSTYKNTIDCFVKTLKNEVCLYPSVLWDFKSSSNHIIFKFENCYQMT